MGDSNKERSAWCRLYMCLAGGELLMYRTVEDNGMAAVIVEAPAAFVVTKEKYLIRVPEDDVDRAKEEAARGKEAAGFLGTVSDLWYAGEVEKII